SRCEKPYWAAPTRPDTPPSRSKRYAALPPHPARRPTSRAALPAGAHRRRRPAPNPPLKPPDADQRTPAPHAPTPALPTAARAAPAPGRPARPARRRGRRRARRRRRPALRARLARLLLPGAPRRLLGGAGRPVPRPRPAAVRPQPARGADSRVRAQPPHLLR